MSKKVVVISVSLRANSNSAALAEQFAKGAKDAGNEVEFMSLKDKKIGYRFLHRLSGLPEHRKLRDQG